MSEVIRSSMSSIPEENWERAFCKKVVDVMVVVTNEMMINKSEKTFDELVKAELEKTN